MDLTDTEEGFIDTLVVGYDAELEERDIELVHQVPRPARYLPQEAWVALLLFDDDWWLDQPDRLNEIVDDHPPLLGVRESWPSTFAWPGVEPPGTGDGQPEDLGESPLHQLGYNVSALGSERRWAILVERAVPTLGLQPVADHIAFLVKMRKLQTDGRQRYRRAISAWEHDLKRLKETYYHESAGRFPWPGTEP